MSVVEDLAYVADGAGLLIFDLSDPARPVHLRSYFTSLAPSGVAVDGELAFLAVGTTIQIVDVGDPLDPRFLSQIDVGVNNRVNMILVDGANLYAACTDTLHAVDVSDPSAPVVADVIFGDEQFHDLDIAGDVLVAANGDSGVRLYDAADPRHLSEIAWYGNNGIYRSIDVVGDIVYATTGFLGIAAHDISDPTSPSFMQIVVDDSGSQFFVRVIGDHVYYVEAGSLRVADAVQAKEGAQRGAREDVARSARLSGDGTLVYYAQNHDGFQTFLPNPEGELSLVSVVDSPDGVRDAQIVGHIAYLADERGLYTLDVSEPGQPLIQSFLAVAGQVHMPTSLQVVGDTAYIVGGIPTFVGIDVSDPRSPVVVSQLEMNFSLQELVVLGQYAYGINGRGLHVLDLGGPEPVEVALIDTPGGVHAMAIDNGIAYVTGRRGEFTVLDITDPLEPRITAERVLTNDDIIDVVVRDGVAYLAVEPRSLYVIDVSDPSKPGDPVEYVFESGGPNEINTAPRALALKGDFLYFATNFHGLYVHWLGGPEPLQPVAYLNVPGTYGANSEDITITSDSAYISGGRNGLVRIGLETCGISVPLSPRFFDLDMNGVVNEVDLSLLLAIWGECLTGLPCTPDVNFNGMLDSHDLASLLAMWGRMYEPNSP